MAKVTGAFTGYQAKGNREDLSDSIYNLDPTMTPILSAVGRRNVSNTIFSWQTDSLPAVNLSNAQEEGFQNANTAVTATTLQTNVTQISKRDATVSGSQEAIASAGRPSDMAYQMVKASKALKNDMEAILSQNQNQALGDDTTPTARKTRALEHFIQSNVSTGTGYAAPGSATAAMTDGTTRTFTEALLTATLQSAYTNTGKVPSLMIAGPKQKGLFSGLAGRSTVKADGAAVNTIVASADVFVSDFGVVKVVPSVRVRTRTVLLIDPGMIKVAYFRPFKTVDLAKVGDADTKMIVAEWGVEVSNELAHAKIADLS